jgi:hypothetical protein
MAPRFHETPSRLARKALFSFTLTFMLARAVVVLIMARFIPNFFFFLHGTHVHHLNYGIFLLAAVGGYLLFKRPDGPAAELAALAYGFALALTFDEFGMWLHLGGSYWQRTSVDAVIIVAAIFAMIAFTTSFEHLWTRHRRASLVVLAAVIAFVVVLLEVAPRIGDTLGPALRELESASSP